MSSQQSSTSPIDNELFRSYSQYILCKMERSNDIITEPKEKAAMVSILKAFQHIDGNVVCSILNEVFERSSITSYHPIDDKRAEMVSDDGPSSSATTKDSTNANYASPSQIKDPLLSSPGILPSNMISVIDLTLNGETDGSQEPTASGESSDSSSDHLEDPVVTDDGYLTRKGKERAEDDGMQGILSNEAIKRLGNMLRYTEETKRALCKRMQTVNDSFDVQVPFPSNTSSYGNTEIFTIKRNFDRKSRLHQSQEQFAAYKIGKLIQRDKRLFLPDIVRRNTKRYYQGLMKRLKFHAARPHQRSDFAQFPRYCERVVGLVEKIGLYTIFMPEIIPPSCIKITTPENFEKIERYLDQQCSCFKNIAHLDENEELKTHVNNNDDPSQPDGQGPGSTSKSLG
ncbi:hypothetical protein MBANPS3_007585 [Mucor bainieri]